MNIFHNNEFQPCSRRDQLTQVDAEGSKERVFRCTEPNAEHYFKIVTPPMCDGCPLRAKMTEAAITKCEYKPPLVENYREIRSRKKDAEVDTQWLPCQDREVVEVPSCCGTSMELKMCNSVDCFRMGSEVSREMCRKCFNRRE